MLDDCLIHSSNYLHLLDIHTGETHPLARIPSIPLPAPMHSTYDIQTWGNKVAMLIRWLDGNLPLSRIVVWDWHLGVPIIVSFLLVAKSMF